jgi:hypothetical protein
MIYKKTKMVKKPPCCCDCREWCAVPVECSYNSSFKKINHVMPESCPLVEMPGRDEAKRMILEDTSEMEVERNFDEGMEALLDKLGFREG